jgi:predicted dithiol-disulfide oxidoreductase (DUF899 family)
LDELFESRDQLAVYQFMDLAPDEYCQGCTKFTSNVTDVEGLARKGSAG